MATFELYRRSTIGMCLTETLDEMVSNGTLSPELAIQVLVQFDKVSYIFSRFFCLLRCHIFVKRS
jgi:Transcription initiation factor IIA, gamma subunit, helical domain